MKPETRSFYELAVTRTIARVVEHLDDAVDLQTLAAEACLSPHHFHRIFRGMVGETPLELARRLRLERAAWQLVHSDASVTSIAFDAGYETHESFTRAFRATYLSAPSDFRKRAPRRHQTAAPSGIHFDPDGAPSHFTPRDTGGISMQVDIEDMATRRLATVRHTGPYYEIGRAFEKLGSIAGRAGLFAHGPTEMIAIYHDDPDATPPNELRSDAALVVPAGIPIPEGMGEDQLPAGRYARTRHRGSYEGLPDAWSRFMGEWLPASGHRVAAGPAYEIYRNTPMDTPKEQLETDLYVPLA